MRRAEGGINAKTQRGKAATKEDGRYRIESLRVVSRIAAGVTRFGKEQAAWNVLT